MADATVRRRFRAALFIFGVVWPSITVVNTAATVRRLPYYSAPWGVSFKAAAAGTLMSLPEIAVAALLLIALSTALFTLLDRRGWVARGGSTSEARTYIEGVLLLLSGFLGTALWYPAALRQSILGDILLLPFGLLIAFITLVVVVLGRFVGAPGRHTRLILTILAVGALLPAPSVLTPGIVRAGALPEILVLGLDSLSHDEAGLLRDWTSAKGGTVYTRATAPALLTNAVWASILAGDYPSAHGVSQTFQPLEPQHATLLKQAREQGYRTVARFSDQLTCSAGSDAGFDENLSGPLGWRQLILPLVHNSSIFLPLIRPLFPRGAFFASPPNLAGSFSFSLERELDEILHSGGDGRTLVAAHLTYLHLPAYPRMTDLTWIQRWRVFSAQTTAVRDRSFDWADSDRPLDPIPVHEWKRLHLLRAVSSSLDRSELLRKGGKVVLFSDHGERLGLNPRTLGDPKYHHVLLTTMNLPSRSPDMPRSLVDIGYLLGFGRHHPDPPRVEFAAFPTELWAALVRTAQLQWSGRVVLDPVTASRAGAPVVLEPWQTER